MYQLLILIVLIITSAAYAAFDVFNKRNVPDTFVYASVAIGVIATLTYGYSTMLYSFAIAAVVAVPGYIMYKKGFLGGGDSLEFIAISLLLPIQPLPLLATTSYIQIPFILSVLIAAGYVVSIYIPIYYLTKTRKKLKIDRKHAASGVLLLLSYAILIIIMYSLFYIRSAGIVILGILGVASFFIIIFEGSIYGGMVSNVYPKDLEPGDMIAVNLMTTQELASFRKKSKTFGRLVTKELLSDIKHEKSRLPVYRDSVPFALFIFIGIIISLLVGNLILLIIA